MEENFKNVVKKAITGDSDSIKLIIDHYMPNINSNSFDKYHNAFDEDCKMYIIITIIKNLKKFKFE